MLIPNVEQLKLILESNSFYKKLLNRKPGVPTSGFLFLHSKNFNTLEIKTMNYKETLSYLYTQLPMFQRTGPAAFKKDLSNILRLSNHLDNPHEKLKCIHLAGTNGKGSTAHLLASVLQASGLKVGLYTSPHYRDFRERIKINGVYISKRKVVDFVAKNKSEIRKIGPSFFEITVALAFDYFAKEKVDIAVIETGLGGRLDSTNIITPLVSVITNISFDHQQFLGDTLPAIAGEKAGIIKPKIPVVIGEKQREVFKVFKEKAKKEKASLYVANGKNSYDVLLENETLKNSFYTIKKNGVVWAKNLPVNIHGPYQSKNIGTALMTLEVLNSSKVISFPSFHLSTIQKGFKNLKKTTTFLGRWHPLGNQPLIIADSAHNEAGLKNIFPNQKLAINSNKKLHIVFGTVRDKDVSKIFPFLPKEATYYFVKANIPRGFDGVKLQKVAAKFQLNGKAYTSVRRGLAAAKRRAKKEEVILICGSIFVVAEVI